MTDPPKEPPLTGDTKEQHSEKRIEAEAQFKQAQKLQPAAQPTTEAGRARADYIAAGHAERAKTARLKELREAKETADEERHNLSRHRPTRSKRA
jgi:phage terminase small subunit